MVKKRVICGVCLGIIAAFPLSAANVSVVVIESGRTGEFPGNQYPIVWENSLMDVFFEAGHIVSNAPIIRLAQKPKDSFPHEAGRDFEIAKGGGMAYFIIAIVDYEAADVSLRLFNTKSPQMIQEQKYKITTFNNNKLEYDNIKAAIRIIAAYMN